MYNEQHGKPHAAAMSRRSTAGSEFWGRVVERMRAAGWYLLDPRLVRIKFKPLQADGNGIYPKG
jgi:hypothetical protein